MGKRMLNGQGLSHTSCHRLQFSSEIKLRVRFEVQGGTSLCTVCVCLAQSLTCAVPVDLWSVGLSWITNFCSWVS